MHRAISIRPALAAGRVFFAAALALATPSFAQPADDPAALLARADETRTSNHAEFLELLKRLQGERSRLDAGQAAYLRYLEAYESSYSGDFETAIPALKSIIDESPDVTLRYRAGITLTNILALSAHYDEAYARLNDLLELQPKIADRQTRLLGYGIAALLYNQAGQYDLALSNAERWIAEDAGGGACKGMNQKIEALYRSGRLGADSGELRSGVAACTAIGDLLYANLIRTFAANASIDHGDPDTAIRLLGDNYADIRNTRYARLISEVDSILARAWLRKGDPAKADEFARNAIDKGVRKVTTKPLVDAYEVLYEVAKQRGDLRSALDFHEKFANADKGYLNDTTARTLAYQMVNQQVLDKKRQIDALNEKNQVLRLQGEVAAKAAETERLYVTLLVFGLASIALWAYRTKRSQVKFQKLARRDGLTGIVNRQHFMDEAKISLQYSAKSRRDVSLILIDLDNFKTINDTYGHVAGDAVLKQTVAVCQKYMRSVDLFGRLGGEEFGVLLPDCPMEAAARRAEDLRAAIAGLTGVDVAATASFGVTSARESGYELRQLLIHADSALYQAKRSGRNRVEAYSELVPRLEQPAPAH